MNASGYAVYDGEDKTIAEKLAAPDVDEAWASQHIERCKAEIHGTWSIDEAGRRECQPATGVEFQEIPRIDFRSCGLRIA
jgi:hypothetical protein